MLLYHFYKSLLSSHESSARSAPAILQSEITESSVVPTNRPINAKVTNTHLVGLRSLDNNLKKKLIK
jgi:hypothetical protein